MKFNNLKNGKNSSLAVFTIGVFFLASCFGVQAQTTDSLKKMDKKLYNTIKYNLTSNVFFDNSFQFSYERVIKKNQTINIFIGSQQFPGNLKLNLDSTSLSSARKKTGFSLGAEYRFYLPKENRNDAPHGVYLAPFFSYYQFKSDRSLIRTTSTGTETSNLVTTMAFLNVGGELGYQFVIKKRWVIDAVLFGPAITYYNFNAKLHGNIPNFDENEAIKKIIDALKEKLPLLNEITSDQGISGSGREAFWSGGFKYNICVGFRF